MTGYGPACRRQRAWLPTLKGLPSPSTRWWTGWPHTRLYRRTMPLPASTYGDETPGGEAIEVAGGEMPATTDEVLAERLFPAYRVYSRQWDEERPARHFLQPGDTRALDQLLAPDRQRVRQLAHRLQRRLRARQLRHWSFDQEQGLLDPRRLGRLLVRNGGQAVFRVEEESLLPEACVSLLVDQSGSMTAERRLMAALAIDLAVHSLQLCRIRCEVLGYTTRYGPTTCRWRERGGAAPGRPTPCGTSPKHAAPRQARLSGPDAARGSATRTSMANPCTGSATLRRPEPRKLLIVLSDGAPFDAATARPTAATRGTPAPGHRPHRGRPAAAGHRHRPRCRPLLPPCLHCVMPAKAGSDVAAAGRPAHAVAGQGRAGNDRDRRRRPSRLGRVGRDDPSACSTYCSPTGRCAITGRRAAGFVRTLLRTTPRMPWTGNLYRRRRLTLLLTAASTTELARLALDRAGLRAMADSAGPGRPDALETGALPRLRATSPPPPGPLVPGAMRFRARPPFWHRATASMPLPPAQGPVRPAGHTA